MVTAIITTHNRCNDCLRAIQSVKNQTYKDIECIVVDDASTDNTFYEMQKLNDDGQITYVRILKENSKGGNYARNLGITNAHGEYIAFLDDDDEWLPSKIEKQLELMDDEHKVCYCGRIDNYNNGKLYVYDDVGVLEEGDLSKKILTGVRCTTSEMIIEKQFLIENDMFDESLAFWQEYELCIRLFQKTKVSVVRECLVIYAKNLSDRSRLTNKIAGWEQATTQIENKNKLLFDSMSDKERMEYILFKTRDGISRCANANDNKKLRKYLLKQFQLTKAPKDLVKTAINMKPRIRDNQGNIVKL